MAQPTAQPKGECSEKYCMSSAGFLLSLLFHWPSSVTLAAGLWKGPCKKFTSSLTSLICLDFLLRLTRLLFVLVHELAHIVLALLIVLANKQEILQECRGGLDCWRLSGLPCATLSRVYRFVSQVRLRTGHSSLDIKTSLLCGVLPGTLVPGMHVEMPAQIGHDEFIRFGGLLVSLFLTAFSGCLALDASPLWEYLFLGSAMAAAGSLLSDLPGGPLLGGLAPSGCFCCGNWGCILPREILRGDGMKSFSQELFPRFIVELLSSMLDVVELRGAQAGGCMTFLGSGDGKQVVAHRSRVVKSKRGRLASVLFSKLQRELSMKSWSFNPLSGFSSLHPLPIVVAQGHSRFGTSSEPAVIETHPHQWLGPHQDLVWRCDQSGRWYREDTEVCITVTHNGDFDGWKVFDDVVPNSQIGEWLRRLFHCGNDANGDSPKLAGMMDLLLCQGQWTASVRLAFVTTVLKHVDEICDWQKLEPSAPNCAPSPKVFAAWASVFEDVFSKEFAEDFQPSRESYNVLSTKVREAFENIYDLTAKLGAEADQNLNDWIISQGLLQRFCLEACKCFCQNDMLAAVHLFFERAEGTFGISVSCNLWPEKIVLSAKGQPISLAFDPDKPLAYWASEPLSLSTSWPLSSGRMAGKFRWDMKDAQGEAVELYMRQGSCATEHLFHLNDDVDTSLLSTAKYFALPSSCDDNEERPYHVLIRGVLFDKRAIPLTKTRFLARSVMLGLGTKSQEKEAHSRSQKDAVAEDLHDIPQVINEIEMCWEDRFSLNRMSALKFAKNLGYLMQGRSTAGSDIDVLIYGVENSLWLGQQFAADLSRMFPLLNVVAMSSNWVLGMLQGTEGHVEPTNWTLSRRTFRLSDHAITLGISQSGTTYPTVWSTRMLQLLPSDPQLFGLSGNFDTVLANSIMGDSACFSGNIFSSLSGVRPAEPSTLATVATQHTLTKLLIFSAEHLLRSGQIHARHDLKADSSLSRTSKQMPSCELRLTEVQDLKRLSRTLLNTSEQIIGASATGVELHSSVNESLKQTGNYLSSHLQEVYWATLLPAIYIIVTVTAGFPVINGCWGLIADHTLMLDDSSIEYIAANYVTSFLDALLYCFLAAIFASGHRLFTGRRLWTRYCSRTLVVVDSTMNYKLLRAYASKLRSLAFRFNAFGVAGQNGTDHFVHEMTHLAHSDVILAVGRPDGRLSALAAAESSMIMSIQQARFISGKPSGAVEAISVGHNPWAKADLFARAVELPSMQRPVFLSEQMLGTEHGGHAPGTVMHQMAALAGADNERTAARVPWMEMKELISRLGGKIQVPMHEAETVVAEIVQEQAGLLQIDPEEFTPGAIFAPKLEPSSPGGPRVSRKRNSNTKIFAFGNTKMFDADESGAYSASQVMAFLRGHKMQVHMADLHNRFLKQQSLKPIIFLAEGRPTAELLTNVFAGWLSVAQFSLKMRKAFKDSSNDRDPLTGRAPGSPKRWYGTPVGTPAGTPKKVFSEASTPTKMCVRESELISGFVKQVEGTKVSVGRHDSRIGRSIGIGKSVKDEFEDMTAWRRQEEIRCYAVSRASGALAALGISMRVCFDAWKNEMSKARAEFGATKKPGGPAIGVNLVGKVEGHKLFAELGTLETLYETRVASVERLLAFFVLFHHAVLPLSRLPFISYDIDRSESRLRVASTPAPIGFVESLPRQNRDLVRAAKVVQRGWMKLKLRNIELAGGSPLGNGDSGMVGVISRDVPTLA
eukprot:CAMPEP_0197620904 /NCGR_PEP_ID=MMETSP1338-20131121/1609_1 /TAXON_ID=43686 ORGANISM="Pelagodinium beii, Strain RCC1491" /NCGR_SAMPLE_ID=MMETSP1338 /ASSEMBLY_ACC=CAM_ASM_000754 /LENGTH=1722 /DNA_ID=CAMNT_0043190209 /DNA_START=60 /DNA_END=5225 /DNA_ORIENTATION=-